MKGLLASLAGIAALVGSTVAFAAPNTAATVRLVYVTSPVRAGAHAILVARVHPAPLCTIAVHYKTTISHARGLYPKRPVHGRVSWTWMVGTNTTPGRWPITVNCGSAGRFTTHFRTT